MAEDEVKRDATPEEREHLINLIEAGQVEIPELGKRALERSRPFFLDPDHKPDFTLVDVEIAQIWAIGGGERVSNKGGIEIAWGTVSAGFGTLTLILTRDGKLEADTENMSREFLKAVLIKLAETCTIRDE